MARCRLLNRRPARATGQLRLDRQLSQVRSGGRDREWREPGYHLRMKGTERRLCADIYTDTSKARRAQNIQI
jgi:hypothetical protein